MSEDECCAAQSLALESLRKLHAINPKHELFGPFRYGGGRGTDKEFDDAWEAFQVRFGIPGLPIGQRGSAPAQAHFWAKWHLAVEEVLRNLEEEKARDKQALEIFPPVV